MLLTQLMETIDFHCTGKNTMEVNGYRQLSGYQHSSEYLILRSTEERNSYRFGTFIYLLYYSLSLYDIYNL